MNLDPQKEYDGLTQREHVLKRPDTYVGSIEAEKRIMMMASLKHDGSFKMKEDELQYIPGLERIYLEILSNAADNGSKSIGLGIDPGRLLIYMTDDACTVYNEGRPVSTVWHEKKQNWIPSFVFFELLTGSNYDDSKERKWAGRNGLGAKLAAIFSKYYQVDCHNLADGWHHHQVATKNLVDIADPIRIPLAESPDGHSKLPNQIPEKFLPKKVTNFTQVHFKPDFKLFYTASGDENIHKEGVMPLTDDPLHCCLCWDKNNGDKTHGMFDQKTVEMFAALALDFSFNCKVKIDFIYDSKVNWETGLGPKRICFDARSPMEYVKCYMPEVVNIKTKPIVYESPNGDSRLILLDTPHNSTQRSFANGMPTRQGGVHVNEWLNGICSELKAELKRKGCDVDARNIKNHITIFLSYYCDKPKFETQTKERLTGPRPNVQPTREMFDIFSTWGAVEAIRASAAAREKTKIAKATDGKRDRYVDVEKLDDADMAGTPDEGRFCTLFVCEGDSAKTFFVQGLQHIKDARKYNGCLPLRGKILNTKKATAEKYMANKVCNDLKKALGLQEKLDYSIEKNRNTLRYGRVYSLTDADVDGTHIKILLADFLSGFTGLLESGFLHARLTPVMIVTKSKEKRAFYSLGEMEKWAAITPDNQKWKPHYLKGLGSATKEVIKDAFLHPVDQHLACTSEDQDVLELAMGAENADLRKKLYRMLLDLKPEQRLDSRKVQKVEDVVYEELILSAIEFNRRAIPSMTDGLKDSFRKIVYTALQASSEYEGVGEFQGRVKTLTKYRHGPDAMEDAMIGLCQTFPGSNNVNLLEGQEESFGSRIGNGADHASARYIHCRPAPILKYLIRSEDDILLKPEFEEGKKVGVEVFYPILPIHLLNRCKGMGWGWATDSPNYNPMQLIEWIKAYGQYIKDGKPRMFETPNLIPWYKGYKCVVFRKRNGQLVTRGSYENTGINCKVKDIPLPWSAQKYEAKVLKALVDSGDIEGWKPSYVDPNRPSYILRGVRTEFKGFDNKLCLEKNIVESSMTFLNEKNLPITYHHGVQHVMLEWAEIRYKAYVRRKEFYVKKLEDDVRLAELRQKFILDVIENRIDLRNQSEDFLNDWMIQKGYPLSFLTMALSSLTRERVAKLAAEVERLKKEIKDYMETHPVDLWIRELDELAAQLEKQSPGEWEFYEDYGKKNMAFIP